MLHPRMRGGLLMKQLMIALFACWLSGCGSPLPPSTSSGENGGDGGAGGGSGGLATGGTDAGGSGGGGAPGTCLCEPVPACSNPSDFTGWCGGYGPGPFAATNCTNCAATECQAQPGPLPACFDSALWCCTHDFNPAPQPQTFHCEGGVACELDPDVFSVLCTYDEDVTALTDTDAVLLLLNKCKKKYPQYSCGLWDLTCS